MHLKIGRNFSHALRKLKFHHVTGMIGVLLTAGAFVSLGGLGSWDSVQARTTPMLLTPAATSQPDALPSASGASEIRDVVYLVVGTTEQAGVLSDFIARIESTSHGTSRMYDVLVVDSHERSEDLRILQTVGARELAEKGIVLTIIDLR